jgi:hypothetical protein
MGSSPQVHIQVRQSPYIDAFYMHHPIRLTIDSGAMCMCTSSHLKVVGETRMVFTRDGHDLYFEGLVDILASIPFMESTDVSVHPAKRQESLGSDIVYTYGSETAACASSQHSVRRAHVLRAPEIDSGEEGRKKKRQSPQWCMAVTIGRESPPPVVYGCDYQKRVAAMC